MKRLRHLLAAISLTLGLVYFFTQHENFSNSVTPNHVQPGTTPSTDLSHGLPKQDPSHVTVKPSFNPELENTLASGKPFSAPIESLSNVVQISPTIGDILSLTAENTGIPPASSISINFQEDLENKLPVYTLGNLSIYAPHNYNSNGRESYTYATFMASRNPSLRDPYYLAIHSLVYRILWSSRSKTSKYPFVVFVGDFVSFEQRELLRGAGAIVRELAPLPWHPTDPGVPDRWKDLFAKLNMWNETEFSRILFLDADAFPVAPIDDMFSKKKVEDCIESKLQLDDFLADREPVCEPYIFAGVPADPHSIFDVNINVGSMVFTPNPKQHKRLLQNYLKLEKHDVKMAEQAFLNWQFGVNSAYPPGVLDREYGAFFPNEDEKDKLKVVHEKLWAASGGWMKEEWDSTWSEMLRFYSSEEFHEMRSKDRKTGVL